MYTCCRRPRSHGSRRRSRSCRVRENIEGAEKTREEAKELLEEYRARLKEAREQADDINARARKAAEAAVAEATAEGRARSASWWPRPARTSRPRPALAGADPQGSR